MIFIHHNECGKNKKKTAIEFASRTSNESYLIKRYSMFVFLALRNIDTVVILKKSTLC